MAEPRTTHGRVAAVHIHVIFATRLRAPLLTDAISVELWPRLASVIRDAGCIPRAVGGFRDHVHVLVDLSPNVALGALVGRMKGASSHWLRRASAGSPTFAWQSGYAAYSVSPPAIPRVIDYIRNQREIHLRRVPPSSGDEPL